MGAQFFSLLLLLFFSLDGAAMYAAAEIMFCILDAEWSGF